MLLNLITVKFFCALISKELLCICLLIDRKEGRKENVIITKVLYIMMFLCVEKKF